MIKFWDDISRALSVVGIIFLGGMAGYVLAYFLAPDYTSLGFQLGAMGVAGVLLYHSWMMKVPPIPLPRAVQDAIIAEIPDGRGDIYELGCGFGHLAVALARVFPHRRIVAIEYSIIPFMVAWTWGKISRCRNIAVKRGDFLSMDLSDAVAITSYLYPPLMPHVGDWLQSQCTQPQILLNVNFPIPDLTPDKVLTVPRLASKMPDQIFVYRFDPKPKSYDE